ncbi:hypothetical protein [Peribacillus tepidiphilus]|uniref:hypothetical protein n=1 Tax=Peribacillus tepidiphilus TaxID=2652445 RepID=UPI0035B54E44
MARRTKLSIDELAILNDVVEVNQKHLYIQEILDPIQLEIEVRSTPATVSIYRYKK